MSNKLNEMIIEISKIHETIIKENKLNNIDDVLEHLETYDEEIVELYLTTLLQYYFQRNQVQNVKTLLSLGYSFELTIEDIKHAFLNIHSSDENVIELFEKEVVFFKDNNYTQHLEAIYRHYRSVNRQSQKLLDNTIRLLRKNSYICAFCYKNQKYDFAMFFMDKALLASIKEDMPFLLK